MNSYHDDPIETEGNAGIEQDDMCSERSYGDADLLEGTGGIESDEVTFASVKNALPRPPTKLNVYIDNETVCPECTQPGKFKCYCE